MAHVSELVALSLAEPEPEADSRPPDRRGRTVRAIRAARLSAVKSDIDRNLTDPGLTASAVAGRHGIKLSLTTNAQFLDEAKFFELKDITETLYLSIDSHIPEVFAQTRPPS